MTPSADHSRTRLRVPAKLPKGLDSLVHRAIGAWRHRRVELDSVRREANEILTESEKWRADTGPNLEEMLRHHQRVHRRQAPLSARQSLKAHAAIVAAVRRHTRLSPHPEQVIAALLLERGNLLEMATGEGKTLAIALAAVPAAWRGYPCHVITANDYLAQRDAEWLTPFYEACHTSAAFVTGPMEAPARQSAYAAGVVYTTAKEIVADFLRDQLQLGPLGDGRRRLVRKILQPTAGASLVMRGLHTAIVDEADNALIDEAVTPLIISRREPNLPLESATVIAADLARNLDPERDYRIDLRHKEITYTRDGRDRLSQVTTRLPGMWNGPGRRAELVKQALAAREFYRLGKNYVVQDGAVVIVDEFTGRLMPQRTWQQGLHQAVEAKENLEITAPNVTLARLSFQRFFRLFETLSGITGTAREAAGEFWQIYRLVGAVVPHHRPCIRTELPDSVFANSEEKWQAIVEAVAAGHKIGRPVLVGTRNVAASEHLASLLTAHGLEFDLLNAVQHRQEAEIISRAGLRGRITIATNMAGRGTDIKLGPGVADLGGLLVIATERHESRRIDRQLFGRSARQGDPGSAQAFVSLDDEFVRRYLPSAVRLRLQRALLQKKSGARPLAAAAIRFAEAASERASNLQRANVLRHDTWLTESLSFTSERI